jgi:hypothetical protein
LDSAPTITRQLIEENTVSYYRHAVGTRPDLRVVQLDGRKYTVKDFGRSDRLFRRLIAPILIRREHGALMKLRGVKGVPGVVSRIDRYAFATEHISGVSLDSCEPERVDAAFYDRLRSVLDEIHGRGVAHGDLRSQGNVMIDEDGEPHVVDFAACVYYAKGINPITRWLFSQFVVADHYAVLRIKRRLSPHLLTPEEMKQIESPLPFERSAKIVGRGIRAIVTKLFTHNHAA